MFIIGGKNTSFCHLQPQPFSTDSEIASIKASALMCFGVSFFKIDN